MTPPLLVALLAAVLVVLGVAQLPYALHLVRQLRRSSPRLPGRSGPPALVLLPVRGGDPELEGCVRGLLAQDYPDFEVRIIVDGVDDDTRSLVEAACADHPEVRVQVEALEPPPPTCSLKCGALVQGLRGLTPRHAFVAQVDSDVVPHAGWLRELAAGFDGPEVGAVTGNRWYRPPEHSFGARVRHLWNAAAVPMMTAHGIPWGGTLAIRGDLARSGRLAARWHTAYGDDTALAGLLATEGLRLRFAPGLVMRDTSACSVGEFAEWMERQLLSARLNHPAWPVVFTHGLVTSVALVALVATSAGLALAGRWDSAAWALVALIIYQSILLAALTAMERRLAARVAGAAPGNPLRLVAPMVMAQLLHALAMVRVPLRRAVRWRGVEYRIGSGGRIRRTTSSGLAP